MSDAHVRLFVALELPAGIRSTLAQWGASVVDKRLVRVIPAHSLHVTLCFLGWRAADEVEEIAAACDLAAGESVVQLCVGEALWLPPRRPRVLAVQLHDRDQRLLRLQHLFSERLSAGGWYTPERRPFLAHVSVARVRRREKVSTKQVPQPAREALLGERVNLYRSTLQPGGARYETLHSVQLNG